MDYKAKRGCWFESRKGYSQKYEYLRVVPDVDLDINTQSVFFKNLADNFKPLHVLL